jgi:hypothetical protein
MLQGGGLVAAGPDWAIVEDSDAARMSPVHFIHAAHKVSAP